MTTSEPPRRLRLFGRELDDEAWLARLREAELPLRLGDLGAYELVEEVGRGGQGVVLRARHRVTGELVALKRLRAGALAGDATRRRLEREAGAIAGLDHPGIVGVRELLEVDGQPVVVLDWVEGVPLTEWAAGTVGRPGGLRRCLETFADVARAVAHAHERGVLHRDLKPSNVLVDDSGRARVLDFGLARRTEDDDGRVTRTSEFVGTPVHAAPEQLQGGDVPDVRVDVYALGVLLYEVVTGRLPHEVRGGPAAVLEALRRRDPVPPSQVDPSLPSELDRVVAAALDPDPVHRTPSVRALLEDVEALLDGRPVAARGPTAWRRVRRFARRHRGLVAGTATVFALLAAYGLDRARQARALARERDLLAESREAEARARDEAERQLSVAEEQSRVAAIEARHSQALLDFFTSEVLLGADPDDEVERAQTARRLDTAAARIEEALPHDPAMMGSLHLILARVEQLWDRLPQALAHAERAVSLLEEGPLPRRVMTLRTLGAIRNDLGRFAEADVAYAEAVRLCESLDPAAREEELALLLSDRAGVLWELGRLAEAEQLAERAVEEERELARHEPAFSVAARMQLAAVRIRQGRDDEGAELLSEVLALGAPRPEERGLLARAHRYLAVILRDRGDLEGARRELETALFAALEESGASSLEYAQTEYDLGLLDHAEGQRGPGLERMRDALRVFETILPEGHPTLAGALLDVGAELARVGRPDEARPLLERSLAAFELSRGANHELLLPPLRALARLELSSGRVAEARAILERTLEVAEAARRPDVAETVRVAIAQVDALGR